MLTTEDPTTSDIAGQQASGGAQRLAAYRVLWPMFALLAGEVSVLGVMAPIAPTASSPVLLASAVVVLLAGLLPALFRPLVVTNLVGCSACVLASVLWRAPHLAAIATFDHIAPALDATDIKLGLLNIVLLAPLTLHLAAVFPQRSALTMRAIIGYYILIIGTALLAFALPTPLRPAALVPLMLATYAGFGVAATQFMHTIQLVQPASPRAAQRSRLLLLSLVLAETPFLLLPFSQFIRLLIPYEAVIGAQIILPLSIAYTILRHDVFGIDRALRRTLEYAIVSFGLLVIYFGLAALLAQISRDLGGIWGSLAPTLSILAAAAAFTPLRRAAQRLIDQAFYPERRRFGQTISAARMQLAQVVQRDAVIALFEEELPRQLGAAWARLVLRPSFEQPTAAAQPGVWSTLLLVGGQPLGCYWLGPRNSDLRYDAAEQEQLLGLIQQAALALAYADTFDTLVQLNHELEERVATRTEHVLAQQRELAALDERQRLARDLHDSVKQTLFSLGLGLRSARSRVRTEPDAAVALLQQQEHAAIQAQAELGDLVAHLRTPATGTADLVALLAQHALTFGQNHGLQIKLATPPTLLLPEPLPRELSQIAKEALHNVLRHSGVLEAELTLTMDGDHLHLTVIDHGHGFDPTAPGHGHGLRGMRERVAALGGSMAVHAAPKKGTTLWVQIDLAAAMPVPAPRLAS